MKNLSYLLLISFALFITSCSQSKEQDNSTQNTTILLSIDEFYEQPDDYIGKEVTISGLVTHVCKHGGQKLFITGEENEALRIDVGEDIPEFDIEMEGTEVEFTGKVHLMDEEFMVQADAEEKEHHGEEEDCAAEESVKAQSEKSFYLVAQNFRTR